MLYEVITRKDLSTPEVILTNRGFCGALLEDAQKIIIDEREKITQRRLFLSLEYSDFLKLFLTFGSICLLKRNQDQNFIIDDNNEPIIKQFYFYTTNNPSFFGDLAKGVITSYSIHYTKLYELRLARSGCWSQPGQSMIRHVGR